MIDSGGSAGSQSATLMVRALATGEVHLNDWLKLVARKAFVALLFGAVHLHALGTDPATASAPLITSIAGISGVLIYFALANWYLGL